MSTAWWKQYYDGFVADSELTANTDEEKIARQKEVDFIISRLRLRGRDAIFDQCCGVGRIAIPLAERGLRVHGVDLIATYIARATVAARERGLDCHFTAADAFDFVPDEPCDGAINWFTSFGAHRDDAENRKMLDRAFEALKPGGRLALDYVSVPKFLQHLGNYNIVRRPAENGKEILILGEMMLDFYAGMFGTECTYVYPDGRQEVRHVEHRMLMPHELVRLFESTGFQSVELFGSTDGEAVSRTSPRCIVVGQRPM